MAITESQVPIADDVLCLGQADRISVIQNDTSHSSGQRAVGAHLGSVSYMTRIAA
jgi:hypothetical protein